MERIKLGSSDFTAEIWSRGACVNDLRMPDRDGKIASVVLGYGTEEDRMKGSAYIGEMCGPFANRIAAGGYTIDGQQFKPDLNDQGRATLHGGPHGWSYQDWEVVRADQNSAHLRLVWTDPTGGFPGPISVEVTYQLNHMWLSHTVTATCEVPTILSVVSHPYFNLSGTDETIDDHELFITANSYLPVDEALIPLPQAPVSVEGTPFDFRNRTRLRDALNSPHPQIQLAGGIDHALILDGDGMRVVARMRHQASGRWMEILTNYPALQVYTGQYLSDSKVLHPIGAGTARTGIALETEEYPDAPRRQDFPSALVRPGQIYTRTTVWGFGID